MLTENDKPGYFKEALIHFTGGAIGGTVGTAITCPFEVIKTRMQSVHGFDVFHRMRQQNVKIASTMAGTSNSQSFIRQMALRPGKWFCAHYPPLWSISFKSLWNEGGFRALFKGIGPNLIGVTPSKAIYFCSYSISKRFFNEYTSITSDTAKVHLISAGIGGFCAASLMNPIWVIKTRIQLHPGRLSILECLRRIKKIDGSYQKGLFKGVTGSYMGILETMIQFCLYEWFRAIIINPDQQFIGLTADSQHLEFAQFMLAGGIAKTGAVIIAYPHEIFRTRLREEGNRLTFRGICKEIWNKQGLRGFYRGLSVQLLRSVPNTAFTMLTYELIVHGLHNWPPNWIKWIKNTIMQTRKNSDEYSNQNDT